MVTSFSLDFADVQIFKKFVVVIMKEGITVKPEYNDELVEISEKYFKDRLFGYIGNRRNSYAVNPLVYLQCSKIKNLVGFAVVCEDGLKSSNLEVEKIFLTKPIEQFTNFDDAKLWIYELIEKESPKQT